MDGIFPEFQPPLVPPDSVAPHESCKGPEGFVRKKYCRCNKDQLYCKLVNESIFE